MDHRIRVLVADDETNIRLLFRTMLELEDGFEVVAEAADGEQAVRLAAEEHPDAVVIDLSMPVMDGLTAISAIRRDSPDTKIVVVSSLDETPEARSSGANAYLTKPGAVDALTSVLTSLVS